ncbi:MAG TPA: hypothetical protein VGF45_07145, partial [Polyangia bacterium]
PRTDPAAAPGGKEDPEKAALDATLAEILGPQAPAGDPMELLIEAPTVEPDQPARSTAGSKDGTQ